MNRLFDYRTLADRLAVPLVKLAELEACLRRQHGSDDMLFELRMLRTLEAVAEGLTTVDEAIREFGVGSSLQTDIRA